MTARKDARNDRIAMRYLFGENAATLAREYGICTTRIRQVLAQHLVRSRREFHRQFGQWPDDLARNAVRLRLLHLINQYRIRTGLPPMSTQVLRSFRAYRTSAAGEAQRNALDLGLRAADMRRKYAHVHEDD